jgi:hypothetical protein
LPPEKECIGSCFRHDEGRNARPVKIVSRVVQAKIFPGAPFIADPHVIYLFCEFVSERNSDFQKHRIAVPFLPVDNFVFVQANVFVIDLVQGQRGSQIHAVNLKLGVDQRGSFYRINFNIDSVRGYNLPGS